MKYNLFPFNFSRLNSEEKTILMSNDGGEFIFIKEDTLLRLINNEPIYKTAEEKLKNRSFIYSDDNKNIQFRMLSSKIKTRKNFITNGPGLHIFVITLRCLNSCEYCQASRKDCHSSGYDMSFSDAEKSVDIMFESPSENYTIEFQGGEPTLAIDVIKHIVSYSKKKNILYKKNLNFVVATTLNDITEEILLYFKDENINVSTSLDGPEWLHNKNRPRSKNNSYKKTIKGIELARDILGFEKISAMATLTRTSLKHPIEIIDEYINMEFKSIFLRPLNNYGFAVVKKNKIGYNPCEYSDFYNSAMEYIIEKNKNGLILDEVNASLALNNILTPNSHGYVDLRSPCGDGTGVLVYNYDGHIYPSDEARMLKEMGDDSLCLGSVEQTYNELMTSKPLEWILNSGVAESLPGCSDCVYLPYCGADPISAMNMQKDPIGYRHTLDFCLNQKTIFNYIFNKLYNCNEDEIRVFYSWLNHCHIDEISTSGYKGWIC